MISQFNHSTHGYHHTSQTANANINWYPHQQLPGQELHASKLRNQSNSNTENPSSSSQHQTSNYESTSGHQQSFTGTGDQVQNIKNQRKAAMVSRMRPRSQTGHQNAKASANLF